MWFRRDLRVDDNAALYHALRACRQVVCVFVFDRAILDALPRADRRVEFIRESLVELDAELRALGGGLIVRHAVAEDEIAAAGACARRAGRVRQPRRRARRARARRQGARRAGQRGHRLPHLQGPGHLRARRGADPGRPALHRVHALQARLAGQGRCVLPEALPGAQLRRRAGAAAREVHARRCRRWRTSASRRPTSPSWRSRPAAQGGAALFDDFFQRIDRYDDDARLSRGARPELPGRAPALRHGVDPRSWRASRTSSRCRATRARRPG